MNRTALLRNVALARGGFLRRRARLARFRAKPVHDMATGQTFDSRGEAGRYRFLQALVLAKRITDLELHPVVVLIAARGKAQAIKWRVDYSYWEDGRQVWEDFKRPPKVTRRRFDLATGKQSTFTRSLWTQWDRKLLVLWAHFGPGLLRIVGEGGKVFCTVMPEGGCG
jgi:hypothetical protein